MADAESRMQLEPSDRRLKPSIFAVLQQTWGPFDVDLFAARHNKQLPRFYSFRPDPEAEAVDAMTQNWSKLKPYAFPPFILIGRCLRKIIQDQVMEMTIIVPMWENQTGFQLC